MHGEAKTLQTNKKDQILPPRAAKDGCRKKHKKKEKHNKEKQRNNEKRHKKKQHKSTSRSVSRPMLKRIPLIMKPTTSATSATSLRNTDRRQCLDMVNPHDSTLRKTQCADTLAIRARSLASGRVALTMCGSVCPDDFPRLWLLGRSPTTCGKHAGSFRSLPSAQTALLEVSLIISVMATILTNATTTNFIMIIVTYAIVAMVLLSFLVRGQHKERSPAVNYKVMLTTFARQKAKRSTTGRKCEAPTNTGSLVQVLSLELL